MRLGLQVPNFTWPSVRPIWRYIWIDCPTSGTGGSLQFLGDGSLFPDPTVGPVQGEMLEGWSALAFAAGRTNRIKLARW